MRSKQSIGWAKKAANAPSSAAGFDDALPVSKTRRIFVYVIGGITHRHPPRPPAPSCRSRLQVPAAFTGQGCKLTARFWNKRYLHNHQDDGLPACAVRRGRHTS